MMPTDTERRVAIDAAASRLYALRHADQGDAGARLETAHPTTQQGYRFEVAQIVEAVLEALPSRRRSALADAADHVRRAAPRLGDAAAHGSALGTAQEAVTALLLELAHDLDPEGRNVLAGS